MATHFVDHSFKCNGSMSKCYGNILWQHTLWNKVRVTTQCVNATH